MAYDVDSISKAQNETNSDTAYFLTKINLNINDGENVQIVGVYDNLSTAKAAGMNRGRDIPLVIDEVGKTTINHEKNT